MIYKTYIKRLFDFFISLIILFITSPIFIFVYVLLFIQNKSKVFFYQERPGYNGKAFRIVKFRTMRDARNEEGELLHDVDRMTKAGRILRHLSIDELPQLINVVRGDMSLIGPRPLLFKYISLYSEEQNRRHEVKPGITGWAQVNGRNSISWTKKFELDVYYVDNISFGLDVKIFWLTIVKIVKREGVNQSYTRPMQPFNGKN